MTMIIDESVRQFANRQLELENEKMLMIDYFDSVKKGLFKGNNHERECQINSMCRNYGVTMGRLDEIIIEYMNGGGE